MIKNKQMDIYCRKTIIMVTYIINVRNTLSEWNSDGSFHIKYGRPSVPGDSIQIKV